MPSNATRDSATNLRAGTLLAPWMALCVAAIGCGRAPGPAPGNAPEAPGPDLRLVVMVVVDQLPAWRFEADRELARPPRPGSGDQAPMQATLAGGIARLLDQGVYFSRAELPYAFTYTAPGHAALGTGANPAQTHILSNYTYNRESGQEGTSVDDPDSPVFDIAGCTATKPAFTNNGASAASMAVPGVADSLRQATHQRGKAVSISLKDRSAILATGQHPNLAIWYDAGQLAMTTSRYYTDQVPAWLLELARTHPVAPRLDMQWTPLPGVDHAALTGVPDDNPGEGREYGLGRTFPYRPRDGDVPGKALRATPFADELVIETALAAIAGEDLGQDDVPDLLSISLSAHDYVGHNWGQESWERLDLFLRLDRKLADLFAALDARVGRDHYALVFTSDHGAARLVELARAAGKDVRRIAPAAIGEVAERAAATVLGPGSWVAHTDQATLYVTPALGAHPQAQAALDAMIAAIAGMPGMAFAMRTADVAGHCEERSGIEARVCRSVVSGLSGEIVFAATPGSLIDMYALGSNHGSPNPDDSIVPIIALVPGWPAGHVDRPVSLLQVAPTLAALLGVPAPDAATEPALAP